MFCICQLGLGCIVKSEWIGFFMDCKFCVSIFDYKVVDQHGLCVCDSVTMRAMTHETVIQQFWCRKGLNGRLL